MKAIISLILLATPSLATNYGPPWRFQYASSCDVVVVGGGPGGLWAAENIARTKSDKVCLFERNSELGGRLHDRFFDVGLDKEPVGLGAWRIDDNHLMVHDVVNRFSIPTREWTRIPYLTEARGIVTSNDTYLLENGFPMVYAKGETADSLWNDLLGDTNSNRMMYSSMYHYVSSKLGTEELDYLLATNGGFLSDFGADSPVGYFDFLDGEFADTGHHVRPLKGMSELARQLAASAQSNGAHIFLNQPVQQLEQHGDEYLVITKDFTLTCKKIIIAIPPLALAKLMVGNYKNSIVRMIMDQPEFHSMQAEPVFKAGMSFATPWWETLGWNALDRITTKSTCVGQMIPYVDTGDSGEGFLHAVYSDGPCAYGYWKFIAQRSETDVAQAIYDELVLTMSIIAPGFTVPTPLQTYWKYWDEGAWHMQTTDAVTMAQVETWALEPTANSAHSKKVVMVGEAYHPKRAWTEGAFASAMNAVNHLYL